MGGPSDDPADKSRRKDERIEGKERIGLIFRKSACIMLTKRLVVIFSPLDTPSGLGRGYFLSGGP